MDGRGTCKDMVIKASWTLRENAFIAVRFLQGLIGKSSALAHPGGTTRNCPFFLPDKHIKSYLYNRSLKGKMLKPVKFNEQKYKYREMVVLK